VKTGRHRKRIAGDIVKMDLGDGFACYGRVTGDAGLAVYDPRTSEDVLLPDILSLPISFHISVTDNAGYQRRMRRPRTCGRLGRPPRGATIRDRDAGVKNASMELLKLED